MSKAFCKSKNMCVSFGEQHTFNLIDEGWKSTLFTSHYHFRKMHTRTKFASEREKEISRQDFSPNHFIRM